MDEIRFTCVECHGIGFTGGDGLEMAAGFVCTPCLYATSYEEYYGAKPIPYWLKVLIGHLIIMLIITALFMFFYQETPTCTDGTWVYEQSIEDFVCVKDDGIYTPPTD